MVTLVVMHAFHQHQSPAGTPGFDTAAPFTPVPSLSENPLLGICAVIDRRYATYMSLQEGHEPMVSSSWGLASFRAAPPSSPYSVTDEDVWKGSTTSAHSGQLWRPHKMQKTQRGWPRLYWISITSLPALSCFFSFFPQALVPNKYPTYQTPFSLLPRSQPEV
jgi:hypothetical protein